MNALILSFFEKGVDPALVALHRAQGTQVAQHASDHARNASYCLQKQEASQPFLLGHVGAVSGRHVKRLALQQEQN
jgi:hypothetical protein